MMTIYAHPEWFSALWGVAALLLVVIGHAIWKRNAIRRFGDAPLWKKVAERPSAWRMWVKNAAALAALSAIVIALANPQEGGVEEEVERTGLDIVFAVDLSRSMLCEDIAPSRLKQAEQIIRKTINKSAGDRIGILAFAGGAYTQLPITTDHGAAELTLNNLNPDFLPSTGSEVRTALELAVKMFDTKTPQDRALVILTDGEDHGGEWAESVQSAVDSGLTVYTIGIGTETGGPIPAGRGDYHRDVTGDVVITRRETSVLRELAERGDGQYFDGNTSSAADDLTEALKQLERVSMGMTVMSDMEDQFQYPLAIALAFLLVYVVLTERSSQTLSRWI